MKMVIFVITMFISLSSMLMTTIESSFPNSFENELALSQCYFSSNNWVVLLKLSNDFILLIRWQLSKLLQNLALVLALNGKFFIFSHSLRCLLTRVKVCLRHEFEVTHVIFYAHITSQHINRLLLEDLSFVFTYVITCHQIIISSLTFLSKKFGMWPHT